MVTLSSNSNKIVSYVQNFGGNFFTAKFDIIWTGDKGEEAMKWYLMFKTVVEISSVLSFDLILTV